MRFLKRGRAHTPSAPIAEEPPPSLRPDLPEQLIAARAYELWKSRGCPMGQDAARDWYAARAELEQERRGWAAPAPEDRQHG